MVVHLKNNILIINNALQHKNYSYLKKNNKKTICYFLNASSENKITYFRNICQPYYPLTYMINYEKITPTVHVAANKTVLLSCPKNG